MKKFIFLCFSEYTLDAKFVDSKLCTHIILIGVCYIDNNGLILLPPTKLIQSYVNLKRTNPELKILISLTPKNNLMSKLV